ncbi:Separin [Monosporozyma unispora]|nr:Separin [Kazachstania unispora]
MPMHKGTFNEIGRNMSVSTNSLHEIQTLPNALPLSNPNKENHCSTKLMYYNDEQYTRVIQPLINFIKNTGTCDNSILPSLHDALDAAYTFSRKIHSFTLMKQIAKQHLAVIGKLLISETINVLASVSKFALFLFNETNLIKVEHVEDILLQDFTHAKVLIGMKFLEYIKAFDQHFEIYIKNMDSQIFRKQLTIYATKCSEKSLIDRYINSFYLAYLSQYDDKTLLREILKLKDAPQKQQFIFDKTLMFLNSNMKSISNSREYLADIFQFLKEICLLHSDYKRLDNVINMSYNTFIITKDNKFINASINFEIIKYLSFHNYSNTSQVLQRLTQFALCITDSQSQLKSLKLAISLTKKVDKLAQSSRIYVLQSVVSSFGNLIKQFTSLGLAKEAEFYTKELIRMLPALSEPPLIFQCFCHLHNFYLLSEQERHLESILQKINKIFDHIQGAYDINSLCHYLFANKEYAKIFVSLDIFFGNDANQKSTLGQYWRLQMGETVDETTCFPIYKNINHINHIQNQYNNLMKDIETDPFFGTIFESALASPSLRIKSDIISTSDTSKHESMSTEVITPNKLPRPSNMTPRSKNTRQDFDRFVVTSKLKDIIGELQTTDLNTLSHLELTKHASLYSLVFTTYYSVKINDPSEQLHLKFWFYISDMIHNRPLFYDKHLSSLDNSIYDEMKLYSFNNSSINEQDISWKEPYHFEKESFDFNIVSIDICSLTDNLILSKYNGLFNDWTTLRIPLKGGHSRDVDLEYFSFSDGFKEINDIIKCNDMTTSNKVTNSILTAEGRKNWWNKRYELDKRLENLLSKMSNNWLGGFKGFFDPCVIDVHAFEDFSKQFYHILHEFLPSRKHFKDPSKFIQIEEWILELFLKLDCEDKKYIYQVEDLLFFVLDILLYHGEENAYCEIDISHMHVELTEAIRKYQRNTQQNSILNKETYNQKKHTFLLVSTACHLFPWESLPFLKEFSITRIPSLRSLDLLLMNNDMKFTLELPLTKDIRMILNPNGDLNKTEIRFKELFNKIQESTLNSRLLINEKPSELDFLSFIKSSKLFIYVGHGSGEQYVRLSQIKSCNKVAVSFLLGCSSAAMKYYGKLEPSGSIYSYLLAGCPLVLGNLWDVTDKDIDKFSMSLFEKTGISKNLQGEIAGYQTVPIAVAKSRESCNLKFMNGAAPVIYGLPVHFI